MRDSWLAGRLGTEAGVRLFCLPYAGGGAAAFRGWAETAPRGLQVCPLELPGRGRRMTETPFTRLRPLVRSLVDALSDVLDRPYALYGHSMGALIAFETARALRARGLPQPVHLFCSGAAAPDVPRRRPVLGSASDEEVIKELRFLNGTPRELLENRELMELTLPTVRADFSVLETYDHRSETPLTVPLTVHTGKRDPSVSPSSLYGWRDQTDARTRLVTYEGDHFFLHTSTAAILRDIGGVLSRELSAIA